MKTTAAVDVCLDYVAICNQAIGTLGRRGVFRYVERDELMSIGCLALVTQEIREEALAVTVARRAMIGAIRRNEVRQRGRVVVNTDFRLGSPGRQRLSVGDQWDRVIYARKTLSPVARDIDLWEAIKALPPRQYRVVVMHFWGNVTQAEIAEEIGISQQAVAKILAAAKRSLRQVVNGGVRAMNNTEGEMRSNSQA
jgi:RNA polymerase sigma factor (sigma-70 family)